MDPALRSWAAAHARTVTPRRTAPAPRQPLWTPGAPFTVTTRERLLLTGHTSDVWGVAGTTLSDGRLLLATGSPDSTARIWDGHTGALLHTLTEHTDAVRSVAWATLPNDRLLLATTSYDHTARIWDGHTATLLHTLTAHTDAIYSAAWTTLPNGRLLLATTSNDHTARIWDGHTGALLHTLTAHTDAVISAAWTTLPDGRLLLATASTDGTARIWDGHTATLLHTLTAHTDPVYSVAWTTLPDGRLLLATTSNDGTARIWDGHTATLLHTLTAHTNAVWSVAWATLPDGRLLLATTSNDHTARIWDGHTATLLHTLTEQSEVLGTDWLQESAGGLTLAIACGNDVRLLEVAVDPPVPPPVPARTTEPSGAPPPAVLEGVENVTPAALAARSDAVYSAAWALLPDGRLLLATGSDDGTACIWDGHTGTLLHTLEHTTTVYSAAWALLPDGRLLLATGSDNGTARIWDGHTRTLLHTLTEHTDGIWSAAWALLPDGRLLLATTSDDGTACIWDGHTGTLLHTLTEHTDAVLSAAWALLPDGRLLLATGSDNGTARIWDGHTRTLLHTLTEHTDGIWSAAWALLPDGRLLLATASADNTARIWDGHTGTLLHTLTEHTDTVVSAAWATLPDGRLLLATTSADGTARIWDGHTATPLQPVLEHAGWADGADWVLSPDGRLLLSTGSADGARIWDVRLSPPVSTPAPATGAAGTPTTRLTPAVTALLACGENDLWPPLGLVDDLITLTGRNASPPHLNDGRLNVLADHEGVRRLRDLGWPPRARGSFAVLLAARLAPVPAFALPEGADRPSARAALTAGLDAASSPAVPGGVPPGELVAAADTMTARVASLLTIIGPDAAAADPALPLRLAHHAAQLPPLNRRQLRLLGDPAGTRRNARRSGGGTSQHAPGTVGVSRHGTLAQLLHTQLALTEDLFSVQHLGDQLLYRRHTGEVPPAPRPVTMILDTTPPTYGAPEQTLRLVAHLVTVTLWEYGEQPVLISLTRPGAALRLTGRAQLAHLWSTRTLDPPGSALPVAVSLARSTGNPVVLLAHHHSPGRAYVPGRDERLITTHHPVEPAPHAATRSEHVHLPPDPTEAELGRAVRLALAPAGRDR
ncbi:WD40 repeat domain-containing protein [Streptosporangium sp. NPDC023825]|uniref:WD40 repeat domain-containing protein n=1 Tax=Streptosporangium sp. NPDC023825 TaxID=3154909 RepID=UPI0034409979